MPGFSDMLLHKWLEFGRVRNHCFDLIDLWKWHSGKLRGFLKGWGANLRKESMSEKNDILQQISVLDAMAAGVGLNDDGWGLRYHLEENLMLIYQREEDYWRQRSRIQWTLQGDANTAYFHAIANGRRRKCTIMALASPSGPITDKAAIQDHIYSFYRDLMGTEEPQLLSLVEGIWASNQTVSAAENLALAISFSDQDLDEVLSLTKADTAPGPDGFPVSFFKSCWGWLKPLILNILNEFDLGRLDIARLNFGVLSLIPKVPGADAIKQFRPIALINVIFKFISKAYAIRLTPIAHRTISFAQTAFIKGRQILDGALALHEILDELHVSHQPAIILKLDFEKAYDQVNWAFLRTVLTRMGFESGNIHRLMHLVSGGQTAICINGEIGPFLETRGEFVKEILSPHSSSISWLMRSRP
jgi:hypothetical protein